MSPVMPASFSELRNDSSVVVPARTPIFPPARSRRFLGPSARTIRLAPSRKVGTEKSTCSRRDKVSLVGSANIFAFCCVLVGDPREPVRRGHRNIDDVERGQAALIRQMLGDRPAQIDHKARGFADL